MKFLILVGFFFLITNGAIAKAKKLVEVKVSFMEALAPKDTTSSERFQKEYEYAVETGKTLIKNDLAKCGYKIADEKIFYDASDNLQAFERAKAAENSGAWLIVGPRRSNHYLLTAKGAPKTPSVSIMASAKEVFDLESMHLSLAQSNKRMAEVLVAEVEKKFGKNSSYISIVSEDCVSCVDFSESFDSFAIQSGIRKSFELKVAGDQPKIDSIKEQIEKLKPDFVLLPNYSMVSAYAMGIISEWNSKIFFVGSDGWGDAKYGFVHDSPQLSKANGMNVKGLPPIEKGLEFFTLGKTLAKNPSLASKFPTSGSAQALLKTMQGISEVLCRSKPKSLSEFVKYFNSKGKKHFQNPWGVSVYKLSKGEIIFEKTIK